MEQTREDLIGHLREQLTFLRVSREAFDDGVEAEAKRLAAAIRILVHDTSQSHSVLRQLGVKDRLQFIDTLPGDPEGVPGLAMAEWDGDVWRWVAPLARRSRSESLAFDAWWEATCIVDRKASAFDRRGLVLALAHLESGAHVAPELDEGYAALARLNSIGWFMRQNPFGGPHEVQPAKSPVRANVRQTAWELQTTLEERLAELL